MSFKKSFMKKIANGIPFLGSVWRFISALTDWLQINKQTYGQNKEDQYLWNQIKLKNYKTSIYIDIGSNHPTVISNTYLLYRKGINGIIIEPNTSYKSLFKLFRPKDVFIPIGCNHKPGLKRYIKSTLPSFNFFLDGPSKQQIPKGYKLLSIEYVPVFPISYVLDSIHLDFEWICLMNIDTEGMDFSVLQGSKSILDKVFLICIEANKPERAKQISNFLEPFNFRLLRQIDCNLIFRNDLL